MRGMLSLVSGALAALLLALALPVAWVATHVASEDGYVELTESMVRDETFRDELMAATADRIVQTASLPTLTVEPISRALQAAATELTSRPGFLAAWGQTQRQSHRAVFADPRDLPADLDASNRLVVDVAPIAQAVVDAATERLPVAIDVPDQMLITVGGSDQRRVIDTIAATPDWSVLMASAIAALAVVSVLAARHRLATIGRLGAAAVVAALAVRVVSHTVVPDLVARSAAPNRFARTTQDLLLDRAVESLDALGVAVVVGGALVAAGGFVLGSLDRDRG